MRKPGFVLSVRPDVRKLTPQQERFRAALRHCGIHKGISKAELQDKMRTCIPEYFRAMEEGREP